MRNKLQQLPPSTTECPRFSSRCRSGWLHFVRPLSSALLLAGLLLLPTCSAQAQTNAPAAAKGNYDELVAEANQRLKTGQLAEAHAKAMEAIGVSNTRFEAYLVTAMILRKKGEAEAAQGFWEKALERAPADKKDALENLRKLSGSGASAAPTPLSAEARRKLDGLQLIIEEADKAKVADERSKLLAEFLAKSAPFVKENPNQTGIWTARAAAALELDRKFVAWQAGRKLVDLGADNPAGEKSRKVLAMLERKGWLEQKDWPKPELGRDWENNLGMKFKAVPAAHVLFCLWETRVRDFEAFVADTGHDATEGMYSFGSDGWKKRGHTWKNLGFDQTANHPVCGVNWFDAVKFCEWLTRLERDAGLIGPNDEYRLPTDDEWSAAVGQAKYPWGDAWPPPNGAGNYADAGSDINPKIENYRDGFNRTAPVASFNANPVGLYDLGGNVWEWCSSWYRKDMNSEELRQKFSGLNNDGGGELSRVLRGGSWVNYGPDFLLSSSRVRGDPDYRSDDFGFRCVLVVGASR